MIDHLPECWAGMCECEDNHFYSQSCSYDCICPSLRACEERVLNLNPIAIGVLIAQRARERALDSVREAVEQLPAHGRVAYSLAVSKAKVIEAIDALRTNTSPQQ